ncbi:MAG: MATE family efflux transporter [Spirochaetia bacterium]
MKTKTAPPQTDLLRDPIPGLIFKIALPASIGYFFNTMFNVVDTYFAGRLSTDALAALSLSFPLFMLVLAVGVGIGSGTGALVANSLGSGDHRRAALYQAQALSSAAAAAIIAVVPLFVALEPILRLFDAEGAVLEGALGYMRVIYGGGIFIVLVHTLNAGLQARGKTGVFRNFLILGFLLNIGLDPLFMFGLKAGAGGGTTLFPRLEEAGVALATVLVHVIGLGWVARALVRNGGLAGCRAADFIPRRSYVREIAGQSIPAGLNFLTIALGAFVINYFVSRFGRDAVAAYGTALRIEQIALLPILGLNIALASMVGQNNGAGRIDRVKSSFHTSLLFAFGAMLLILTPVIIFAPALLGIFTDTFEVIRIGKIYLYIQVLTFFSYTVLNQSNSVLQGLKKPGMIMWVGIYRQLIAPFIVFPLFVGPAGLGLHGVWWGLAAVNWSAALWILLWTIKKLKNPGAAGR